MSDNATQVPHLLRPAQVAETLAISRGQVYKLIHSGQIHAVLIAGSVRVRRDELDRVLEFGTQGGAQE